MGKIASADSNSTDRGRRVFRYNVEEMTDMRRYWNKLYPQAPPADEAEIGPNCILKHQTVSVYWASPHCRKLYLNSERFMRAEKRWRDEGAKRKD